MGRYDDIIHLPHHVSNYRKPMPIENRAAQFAPFAALNGYEESIAETGRLTSAFMELSESDKNRLSRKLNYALENNSLVEVTHFIPDKTKSGGNYKRTTGRVKKWEEYDNSIIFTTGKKLSVLNITDIKILEEE